MLHDALRLAVCTGVHHLLPGETVVVVGLQTLCLQKVALVNYGVRADSRLDGEACRVTLLCVRVRADS